MSVYSTRCSSLLTLFNLEVKLHYTLVYPVNFGVLRYTLVYPQYTSVHLHISSIPLCTPIYSSILLVTEGVCVGCEERCVCKGLVCLTSSYLHPLHPTSCHPSHPHTFLSTLPHTATCNGQPLVSVVTKVLSGNHGNDTKLAAAQW